MRLTVLIKQVPDTTEVHIREDYTLERDFVAQIMNPADESALEWALRTRGRLGGSVTVITMGPRRAEGVLREALTRGADRAVLLSDPRFAGADTLITARCLNRAIDHTGGADIIVCGRRAADGETGQVGPMIASMRNIPCVPNAIAASAEETLSVRQLTETGIREWECRYPALITFCEWSLRLRLPSLASIRAGRAREVLTLTPDDLSLPKEACGLKASPTRVVRMESRPAGVRPCVMTGIDDVMPVIRKHMPEA